MNSNHQAIQPPNHHVFQVNLKSIKLFGYHGVLIEEQEKGQFFLIDIRFKFYKLSSEDSIEATVDYSKVYEIAKWVFERKRYNLLENLVQDIGVEIIESLAEIKEARVTATKTNPPVGGDVEQVSVTTKIKRAKI